MAVVDTGQWILTLLPEGLPGRGRESPDVLQAAQERDRGMLSAKHMDRSGEFVLFFNDQRAMLLFFNDDRGVVENVEVWEGPCLVAGFPNRPAWPDNAEEYCCGCGDCYFASGRHSIPRAEGFLLMQECLRIGEPTASLPEKRRDFTQPTFPGMEEFIITEGERCKVEWRKVASGNLL
jgi:hypothetical protein